MNQNTKAPKIDYWIKMWEDMIRNFLRRSYGLTLYNPHILIEDIILEIEQNQFSNSENKKYLYGKLSDYWNNDTAIKNQFYSYFKLLRSIFNSGKNNYILEVAKTILKEFKTGTYFNFCLEQLKYVLTNDEEITVDFANTIYKINQNLIVEFIKKGYSLEDISKFAENIFDTYHYPNHLFPKFLQTKYPHNVPFPENIQQENSLEGYHNKIESLINGLSNENRLDTLQHYYNKKREQVSYIFLVKGLVGSVDKEIAGVTFYSIDKRRYLKNDPDNEENLQKFYPNEKKFLQASVEIEYLQPNPSLLEALTKLETSLNILTCYFNLKTNLEVGLANFLVVKDGKLIFSRWGWDKNDHDRKLNDSIDLEKNEKHINEINDLNFLWNSNTPVEFNTKSKLLNAIHWLSKAEHSNRQEDKILNYWIAVENLFTVYDYQEIDMINSKNKVDFIKEIISSYYIFKFIYNYGWEIYHYYNLSFDDIIPKELQLKANLKLPSGQMVYLEKFVKCLSEIKSYEKDPFMSQKIDELIQFYNNPTFTRKIIETQIQQIQDDLLMIYRFRNLIVHNAHFDNTLLPYYVWKIKEYSGNLIRKLVDCINENPEKLSSIYLKIYLKKEKNLIDLEQGKINFFKEGFHSL